MLRISVDDYVVLFISYKDHLARWAVPRHYSVAMMAERMMDMTDAAHADRRKGDSITKVRGAGWSDVDLRLPVVEVFKDDDHVLVTREERVRT